MTDDNRAAPGEIRRTRLALNALALAIYLLAAAQAARHPSEARPNPAHPQSVSFAAR